MSSKTSAGFPGKLEAKLERVAMHFCAQQGGHYRLISERSAFASAKDNARVELVFVCTKDPEAATLVGKIRRTREKREVQQKLDKYRALRELQELRDAKVLSEEEFLAEKKRIMTH